MQLRTKNGQLSYGSAYKLFVTSWVLGWLIPIMLIASLMLVTTAVSGGATINGEYVTGISAIISIAGFLLLFPVIITLQGLIGGGLMLLGLWLYRRFRAVTVSGQEEVF